MQSIHAHAHAMIFGWVGLFVMEFAYQSFPRFKNTTVPVIPTLKLLLDAHKASAALGPDGNPMPDAPIFAGVRRETADFDKLALLVIRPAIEAAGLTWHGWHAFRRGIASNLYQLGADDLVVQRVLRHSKVQVTREHYIKVRDERVETAMALFEREIEKVTQNRYAVQ